MAVMVCPAFSRDWHRSGEENLSLSSLRPQTMTRHHGHFLVHHGYQATTSIVDLEGPFGEAA